MVPHLKYCALGALSLVPALSMAQGCKVTGASSPIPDIRLLKIAEGLDSPVAITHAHDGSGRLFVLEQAGLVRVIKNKTLQQKPFLDIRQRVVHGGEKGLLGIAFHPRFKDNGRFFVDYTMDHNGLNTVIAEYRLNDSGVADTASERILLKIKQPWSNHNGGQLAFGPDGYLYIAMGDGGSGDDPRNNGQNLNTLLGAILRIDINNPRHKQSLWHPPGQPLS